MNPAAPIDFVIPWVDGADPLWQAEKRRWLPSGEAVDAREIRFRDWDNLRYWFRAVEAFAPWVRTVHFVTCGQKPDWLDPNAPRLHLVDHRDFIPEAYLPTFSSHPIELNMHRIPGLSEQFVYFNDDFFLTSPTAPTDFFRDGLPCDSLSEEPFEVTGTDIFNYIVINNISAVNRHFDRTACRKQNFSKWYNLRCPHESAKNLLMAGLKNKNFFGIAYHHLPQSFLKSTLQQVWAEEPELLDETCSHRFRDGRDINQYLFAYYQLLSGTFSPTSRRKTGRVLSGSWTPDEAAWAIGEGRYKMVCINDTVSDFEAAKAAVNAAFESLLPNKSSFEL